MLTSNYGKTNRTLNFTQMANTASWVCCRLDKNRSALHTCALCNRCCLFYLLKIDCPCSCAFCNVRGFDIRLFIFGLRAFLTASESNFLKHAFLKRCSFRFFFVGFSLIRTQAAHVQNRAFLNATTNFRPQTLPNPVNFWSTRSLKPTVSYSVDFVHWSTFMGMPGSPSRPRSALVYCRAAIVFLVVFVLVSFAVCFRFYYWLCLWWLMHFFGTFLFAFSKQCFSDFKLWNCLSFYRFVLALWSMSLAACVYLFPFQPSLPPNFPPCNPPVPIPPYLHLLHSLRGARLCKQTFFLFFFLNCYLHVLVNEQKYGVSYLSFRLWWKLLSCSWFISLNLHFLLLQF